MYGYFYGRYMKCQSVTQTLAVIPAIHQVNRYNAYCSVQIITDDGVWNIDYPAEEYKKRDKCIAIGGNIFSEKGINIRINTPDLDIRGKVKFGSLSFFSK